MASHDMILAETILETFRLAYRHRRLEVAEHLLHALERLERDGCCCGCRTKAYGLMVHDERADASGCDMDGGGVSGGSQAVGASRLPTPRRVH